MANKQFNISKGNIAALHNNVVNNTPATAGLVIVLLKTTEADSVLEDYTTLAAIIGAAGNVEADFTNYGSRKVLTDTELAASTVDNTGDVQTVSLPLLTWVSAGDGGAGDNTLVRGIVCYAPDVGSMTDAALIPLTFHDIAETTNGNNLNLNAGTYATNT